MCGVTAAENTGFVEVPLVQALAKRRKAYTLTNWIHKSNSTCQEAQLIMPSRPR
jgi:hypothetical protein